MANYPERTETTHREPYAYRYTIGSRPVCEIEMNNLKRIFLISTISLFIILSAYGYLNGVYAGNCLPLKIVTPILTTIASVACIFSYIGLADAYKIAPDGIRKLFKGHGYYLPY